MSRESVIQRLPVTTPLTAPVLPQTFQFIWPVANNKPHEEKLQTVTLPKSLLMELISTCHQCCIKAQMPVPAAVEYARDFLCSPLPFLRENENGK